MLRTYALPCACALASFLLGAVIWFVTHPQEPTLVWGGYAFTSKQEFVQYLESKGASYEVWLSRHPGAAPWERPAAPAPQQVDAAPRPAARTETGGTDDTWVPELPAPQLRTAVLGLMVAAGCASLLLLRRARRYRPAPSLPAVRSRVLALVRLVRRLPAVVQSSTERPRAAARTDRSVLPRLIRQRSITAGDAAFALLGAVAAGMFALYVALLVAS